MAGNSNLSAAVKAKKDEFYTQLTDIEKEMRHYKKHFKGFYTRKYCATAFFLCHTVYGIKCAASIV